MFLSLRISIVDGSHEGGKTLNYYIPRSQFKQNAKTISEPYLFLKSVNCSECNIFMPLMQLKEQSINNFRLLECSNKEEKWANRWNGSLLRF